MEKEKKFVYLVESSAGWYGTEWTKAIGVTDSIEKAEKLAEDFNKEFVEDYMDLPMYYYFFMNNTTIRLYTQIIEGIQLNNGKKCK